MCLLIVLVLYSSLFLFGSMLVVNVYVHVVDKVLF